MNPEQTGTDALLRAQHLALPKRLGVYFAEMGPAWLVTAMFIGGATVITTSTLGSVTGSTYLWAVTLAALFFWAWNFAIMKLTLASGKHYQQLLREDLHPAAYWASMISILLVNTIFHTTQVFLSALVLKTFFGGPVMLWVIVTAAIVLVVLFGPRGAQGVKRFQQFGQGVVWLMLLAFVVCLVMTPVDWGAVAQGIFVPTIPTSAEHILLVTGVVGSSLTVQSAPLLSASARQRRWGPEHMPLGRIEVAVSAIVFMLVNWVLIVLFANTLGPAGEAPGSPIDAALALTPVLGSFATYLFGLGLWFAVVSTVATQVTLHGQMLADIFRMPLDFESNRFKGLAATLLLFGLLLPLVGLTPFRYVIYAAAFNVTFVPLLLLFTFILLNRTSLLGRLRASAVTKVLLGLALAFAAWSAIQFWISR